jgi:hypothetical protein
VAKVVHKSAAAGNTKFKAMPIAVLRNRLDLEISNMFG